MKLCYSPSVCGMCAMACGMVCAINPLIFKGCALCAVSLFTGVGAGVWVRRRGRAGARVWMPHIPHIAHTPYTSNTYICVIPHMKPHTMPHSTL